jgi:glycosyltransferase involved in cell wall biosynthesis
MDHASQPLVSIVTPVFNGAAYLAECIESVLRQNYERWEYLIVNNNSTDSTLDIAKAYAERDDRIHVYNYTEFVDVIESYNRALRLISSHSKYCKVVAADDCLFPECISRTVCLAEANPSVGIVGAYTLRGSGTSWRVVFDGLPCESSVVSGRDACRWHLLGGCHYLGTPTSVLYRAEIIRGATRFFPNSRKHADISAFYEYLLSADLGFVHQVLTYERIHEKALGEEAKQLSTYLGSHLLDIDQYGPYYLEQAELKKRLDAVLHDYYGLLAVGAIHLKGRRFWKYHKDILDKFGAPLSVIKLAVALCMKLADLALNPKQTFEKLLLRMRSNGKRHVDSGSTTRI